MSRNSCLDSYSLIYEKNINKLVISFSLIVFSIGMVSIPRSFDGYQAAIYSQVPDILLLFGIAVIFISIIMYIMAEYQGDHSSTSIFILPMYILFFILLVLPRMLGYIVRGGDAMTHFGAINSIIVTGRIPPIPSISMYPSLHLTVSSLGLVTGGPLLDIFALFKTALFLIFISGISAIINRSRFKHSHALLLLPLSGLDIANNPSTFAYVTLFLMIIFLLYYKKSNFRRSLIIITFTISLWIQHPFVPIVLLIAILGRECITLPNRVPDRYPTIGVTPIITMVMIGIFYFIYINKFIFRLAINRIIFVLSLRPDHISQSQNTVSQSPRISQPGDNIFNTLFNTLDYTIIDFVWLVLKRYGGWIILLGIACFGLISYFHMENKNEKPFIDLIIPIIILLAIIWSVVEFIVGILPSISFIRILRPGVFLAVVPSGLTISLVFKWAQGLDGDLYTITALISILVIVAGAIGLASTYMYSSPSTIDANSNYPPSSVTGYDWFFSYNDESKNIVTLGRQARRFADYLLPHHQGKYGRQRHAPPHLGYPQGLAATVGEAYYIETERGRNLHLQIGDTSGLSHSDYSRFASDSSIERIYSNGNIRIFAVHSQ